MVLSEDSDTNVILFFNLNCSSFTDEYPGMAEQPTFLGKLIREAAELEEETGEKILELFSSVCNYETFLRMHQDDNPYKTELLLDLYLSVKNYEIETGRSVLHALRPLYQSGPALWSIYLSDGMTSLLLEVLKLQREKKSLEVLDLSNEESEVTTFFQCLPYISQLRYSKCVF